MFANFVNLVEGDDDDQIMIRNLARTISNLTGANGSPESGVNNIIAAAAGVPGPPMPAAMSVLRPQLTIGAAKSPQENSKKQKVTRARTTVTAKTTVTKAKSIVAKSKKTRAKTTPVDGKMIQSSSRAMVLNAIRTLDEPGGSSLNHIKQFIYDHYDVNQRRIDIFIRKYLKKAYLAGELVQKRGKPFNVNRKFQISRK